MLFFPQKVHPSLPKNQQDALQWGPSVPGVQPLQLPSLRRQCLHGGFLAGNRKRQREQPGGSGGTDACRGQAPGWWDARLVPTVQPLTCCLVLLAGRRHSTSSLTSESIGFGVPASCSLWFVSAALAQGGFFSAGDTTWRGAVNHPDWSLTYHRSGRPYLAMD